MTLTSFMESLMPYFVAAIVAALVYAAQWFRIKTQTMTEQIKETRKATDENRVLIEKNTVLTESIERNSNGMSAKLAQIAASTAFSAGKIKAKDDSGERLEKAEQEELDAFESGFVTLQLKDSTGESIK